MDRAWLERVASHEWIVLLLGVAALSWAAPLIRLADAPPLVVASLRMTFAALPLLALSGLRRREELSLLGRRDVGLLLLAGLALAAHFGFWVASLQDTSIAASTAIVATQPLIVGLGAWLWLRERPTSALFLAIAIAGLGALLLAGSDLGDGVSLRGDAFAALGAVFASIYLIAGRRVRAKLSNVSYAALVNAIAALALLAALAASGESLLGWGAEAYIFIVLLALVPQLIGHGSLTWALGSLPAAVVAVAVLGEPVGATAIGATLLDERPTLLEALGCALLLAGVYVALRGGLSLVRREEERA
ncbi:MAG: DMT family transporter [Chloroflexi bacterium]|nr:DMT family transporter [Chloroflexota bacterium]